MLNAPSRDYASILFGYARNEIEERGHVSGDTAARLAALGVNVGALEHRIINGGK